MIRLHLILGRPLETFHDTWAAQLNDTHPAIAVAELMRLLVDEHALPWDTAWSITRSTLGYTNHTLLPEALEKWTVELLGGCCPPPRDHLRDQPPVPGGGPGTLPGDEGRVARMSIIDEGGERAVRMAHLATVGSHTVNGVAALHARLLTETVLRDFYDLWPGKFEERDQRGHAAPLRGGQQPAAGAASSRACRRRLAEGPRAAEAPRAAGRRCGVPAEWREVKLAAKRALAKLVEERAGVAVDPEAMFDVQVKRLHEYKRQHLNVLHILALYLRLKRDRRPTSRRGCSCSGPRPLPAISWPSASSSSSTRPPPW